jgi:hypothetical protein
MDWILVSWGVRGFGLWIEREFGGVSDGFVEREEMHTFRNAEAGKEVFAHFFRVFAQSGRGRFGVGQAWEERGGFFGMEGFSGQSGSE